MVDELLSTYIPEQKNRPSIEIVDGVTFLGKTTWINGNGKGSPTKIVVNKELVSNDDLLRQTLAHEIIHHHLYQKYGNKVAKHGEYFNLFADKINVKEGKNFVSQYADNTEFRPNGD